MDLESLVLMVLMDLLLADEDSTRSTVALRTRRPMEVLHRKSRSQSVMSCVWAAAVSGSRRLGSSMHAAATSRAAAGSTRRPT
jgi:hypothetical protein